ncbi:MAG: Chemotaxis protein CheY [Firmicutes bacterium]|nr:Chemotaxis protein CheY [candidate division NPL-UPA2 bacterium]
MAKVLIVEDEPGITLVLTQLLLERGHDVASAPNGWRGLQLLKQQMPDITFVDLHMPEMDGRTLVEIMQTDAKLCRIPVVLMTASLLHADALPPWGSFRAVLRKPFDLTDVLSHIEAMA